MISIYLADDHVMFRQGLKLLLEKQDNMTVVGEASNGREAYRDIVRNKPDIAVLDIIMEEMNGIDATEAIRKECPATRVIILTMNSSQEHVSRAMKAGASAYLLKEFAGEELVRAINDVHAGKQYFNFSDTGSAIDEYIMTGVKDADGDVLSCLSLREREILQLIAEGKSNRKIGDILFLAPSTIATYRHRIMEKLRFKDHSELIKFTIRQGLIKQE
jgi:DNA-binding NarL/FixJ family response regulator